MATISELQKERETKTSALFIEFGVFFAFSDSQFHENKTALGEGEKYKSIGAGGYLPSSKAAGFWKAMDEISKWYKNAVKGGGLRDAEILDALQNHECFYTGDWLEVVENYGFPKADVLRVYNANYEAANA